ncbi:uncharacterized protein AAES06_005459 [Glossophaga mutica]
MIGCLLYAFLLGTKPASQVCALTGNRTCDLSSVCGTMPNQLSHMDQDKLQATKSSSQKLQYKRKKTKASRSCLDGDPADGVRRLDPGHLLLFLRYGILNQPLISRSEDHPSPLNFTAQILDSLPPYQYFLPPLNPPSHSCYE